MPAEPPIRTLVVDDDFRVSTVHAGYVSRVDGFLVVGEAHSGHAALEAVERLSPDLVLLDLYLPDLPGLEVLRRLRRLAPPWPDVIVISAARDAGSIRWTMQAGALLYLVKPFDYPTLRERLTGYRKMRVQLTTAGEIDQPMIDEAYGTLRPTSAEALPKGHSRETLELILKALESSGTDLTTEQAAERAGVSRATAHRYLAYLARIGRVEVSLRYGSGRPEHRYRPVRLSSDRKSAG